ncbi:hypothetical protein EVAR_62361_1 [Eumeta japonica]|uniref:Uncharacterized protein n=1 Tax=Eumeta variegata TaxID=151549 RepID=A0A4C2A3F7_EUMVA|nr:hypothetical protein EVAR_62361_1 [Eumeta japonica]
MSQVTPIKGRIIKTTQWKVPKGQRNTGRPITRRAEDIIQVVGKDWINLSNDRDTRDKSEEALTQRLSKVSLGFELLLDMKHHARRLFRTDLQNSSGHVNLSDEFHVGHPSTAANKKNVDAVRL